MFHQYLNSPFQKRRDYNRRSFHKKFKALKNLPALIEGINLVMSKKEYDDFFESYDAIFEKEIEKQLMEGASMEESYSKFIKFKIKFRKIYNSLLLY